MDSTSLDTSEGSCAAIETPEVDQSDEAIKNIHKLHIIVNRTSVYCSTSK